MTPTSILEHIDANVEFGSRFEGSDLVIYYITPTGDEKSISVDKIFEIASSGHKVTLEDFK